MKRHFTILPPKASKVNCCRLSTVLPSLEIPGQFISKHANVADYAIASVSSKHSRRTYESRLRMVAGILGYEDPRQVPWENLRYQHVLQLREYLYHEAKKVTQVSMQHLPQYVQPPKQPLTWNVCQRMISVAS